VAEFTSQYVTLKDRFP
jgi:hypothetical protein